MKALATVFIAAAFAAAAPVWGAETPVRVLVSENQKFIRVVVRGGYAVRALPSLELLDQGKGLNAPVVPTPRGLKVGGREFAVQGVRIEPAEDRDLLANRSRFRGYLDIRRDPGGTMFAVNTLGMEKYLYGVLHHEVSAWWPMEALKAQAIAARSYAAYQASVSRKALYDLKSSTSSQVYGGSTTERLRTKRAVDLTAGQVLAFEGKVFPAYFHATCAGKTAAASELWKISMPPLDGGSACGYCKISPHYYWNARVPLSEIEDLLKKNGRPVGQLLDIAPVTQTPSHRVGRIRFRGTLGESVIAAKDFRVWIGGNRMKSTAFTVSVTEDAAVFRGKGWGHGVGLCQWGALGQALLGRKHGEILRFYYPKSKILGLPGEAEPA